MNIFDTAKAKAPKAPKAGKPEEIHYETSDLHTYAQIDALEKQLDALKKTLRPTDQMIERFLVTKGGNYKGQQTVDGVVVAKASLECRKRSSTSKLNELEIAFLEENGVSMEVVAGEFKLNIAGVSAKKLQEVSDAIAKVKGLPEDFLEYDTKKAKTITTESSIADCFKLNDPDTIKAALRIVCVPSVKVTSLDATNEAIIATVAKELGCEKKNLEAAVKAVKF